MIFLGMARLLSQHQLFAAMLQPLPHTQQVPQAHQSSTYTQITWETSICGRHILLHKHLRTTTAAAAAGMARLPSQHQLLAAMLQPLQHTQQVPQAHQSSNSTYKTCKTSICGSHILLQKHVGTATAAAAAGTARLPSQHQLFAAMLKPLPHTQQVPQAHQSSTYTSETVGNSICRSRIYHTSILAPHCCCRHGRCDQTQSAS
jgi:hypothetical protein